MDRGATASGADMRLTLCLEGAPLEVVVMLVQLGGVMTFVRDEDGTYAGSTVSLTPAELITIAGRIIEIGHRAAQTAVIPRYRDSDQPPAPSTPGPVVRPGATDRPWAFCPDHPLWEPLKRSANRGGQYLICTANNCDFQTADPDRQYVND